VRSRWGRGDVHALPRIGRHESLGQGASARGEKDHRQADTDAMLTEAGRCILALAADAPILRRFAVARLLKSPRSGCDTR
jgi:hypothetical protein